MIMKKVNIAQLLKDCPKGMELYSPLCGKCVFDRLNMGTIICKKQNTQEITFTSEGYYMLPVSDDCECMLFPSRENRDWNTFYICPFKKGDFIVKEYQEGGKFLAIFSHFGSPYEYTTNYLCLLKPDGKFKPNSDFGIGNTQEARLATDSEKKELLDAMAKNGYYWDECSMTLKKLTLKFKVGDTIHKKSHLNHTIVSIEEDRYRMKDGFFLRFVDQHEWEVAKFDINSLKPFDKVLARDKDTSNWYCNFYSHHRNNTSHYNYGCMSSAFHQCIPYNDETKHLVGTNKECPEYYKTWE